MTKLPKTAPIVVEKARKPRQIDGKTVKNTPIPREMVAKIAGKTATRPQNASLVRRRKRSLERWDDRGSICKITAKADKSLEILLFGPIGQDFWGDGMSASQFVKLINDAGKVDTITVRINSGGGDVFDGIAIYNTLHKHPATVNIEIEGVAASIATVIAMSGDTINIAENAHWMVHGASGMVWGNAKEIRQYADLLDQADGSIRLTYEARTGIADSELRDMMSEDTWMTAAAAKEAGFVDSILAAKKVTPDVSPDNFSERKIASKLHSDRYDFAAATICAMAQSASESNESTNLPTVPPPAEVVSTVVPVVPGVSSTVQGEPNPITVTVPVLRANPPLGDRKNMNPQLRAKCVAAGMAADLNDEQAQVWLLENAHKLAPAPVSVPVPVATQATLDPVALANAIDAAADAREQKRIAGVAQFRKDVDNSLLLAFGESVNATIRNECYALGNIDEVRTKIVAMKKDADTRVPGMRITFSDTQPRDAHLADVRSALLMRCVSSAVAGPRQAEIIEQIHPTAERGRNWQNFRSASLLDIAKECLEIDGVNVRGMNTEQIAMAALGFSRQAGIRNDAANMTTGSLSYITLDAVNKSLTAAYMEAPNTWRGPMRQAASVPDFKTKHVIKLSAVGNLPVWPDNTDPEKGKLSNEKESYAVEARSIEIDFSYRLIINDDLDSLSRTPAAMGRAASRTVNSVAWAQVTSNPTLSDGQALFLESATGNRKRSNLTTGTAVPTVATNGAMKAKMRLMRGLNTPEANESEDILNLTPTYICGPAALEDTILQLVFSAADPASNKSSAVYNTSRTLMPVIEPLLDASSATAWYLFANPNDVDTVEVTFMQGHETPVVRDMLDFKKLCQSFIILQTFAAKAIDHRGVQKHNGA